MHPRFDVAFITASLLAAQFSAQSPAANDSTDSSGQVSQPVCAQWGGGMGFWSSHNSWLNRMPPHQCDDGAVLIDGSDAVESQVYLDEDAHVSHLIVDADDAVIGLSGTSLSMNGGLIENAGYMQLSLGMESSALLLAGPDNVITGGGVLRLVGANAHIRGVNIAAQLNVAEQTIEGTGLIGQGTLSIYNAGTIRSSIQSKSLVVQPAGDGLRNEGWLGASNGGWLYLHDAAIDNDGGVIHADTSSFVELVNASIVGGTLSSTGNGRLRIMDGQSHWRDLSHTGHCVIGPAALLLEGQVCNDGLINIVGDLALAQPPVPASRVMLADDGSGTVELCGEGEVRMLSAEFIAADATSSATMELVNGPGHTVHGAGFLGQGNLNITNQGTIVADHHAAYGPLLFHPGTGREVINTGELRAEGPAGVVIQSGMFTNEGVMSITEGSRLTLLPAAQAGNNAGGIFSGGTWHIEGYVTPAVLSCAGANITMNAAEVTLKGPAARFALLESLQVNTGALHVLGGHHFETDGLLTNYGELEVDGSSKLRVNGAFTQSGSGHLKLRVSNSTEANGGRLTVNGLATLGGTLEIDFVNPDAIEGQVVLIEADACIGEFGTILAPSWVNVGYENGNLVLTTNEAPLPSDHKHRRELVQLIHVLSEAGSLDQDIVIDQQAVAEAVDRWMRDAP